MQLSVYFSKQSMYCGTSIINFKVAELIQDASLCKFNLNKDYLPAMVFCSISGIKNIKYHHLSKYIEHFSQIPEIVDICSGLTPIIWYLVKRESAYRSRMRSPLTPALLRLFCGYILARLVIYINSIFMCITVCTYCVVHILKYSQL